MEAGSDLAPPFCRERGEKCSRAVLSGIDRLVEIVDERIFFVEFASGSNKMLSELRINPPVVIFVGVGER